MNGLIELVFDNVPTDKLGELVYALLKKMNILQISHSENGDIDFEEITKNFVDHLCQQLEKLFCISVLGHDMLFGSVHIINPLIRLICVNGENTVELDFDRSDVGSVFQDVPIRLAIEAKMLADRAGVTNFFCGFEPTIDESIRFFTRDKMGPLISL
jgi:hypothetical protein